MVNDEKFASEFFNDAVLELLGCETKWVTSGEIKALGGGMMKG